jgi:AcrR family transcriptional regulator
MASTSSPSPVGRPAQRRRTRQAILDATTQLLRAGQTPTLDEIALAAEVSRRTIYLHFPTLDQLLIDASMGILSENRIDAAIADAGNDVAARVDALVLAVLELAQEGLPLGRRMVALTANHPRADGITRGQRRVAWIELALDPIRSELSADQYERLAAGLAVIVGWESMIVLRDICGVDEGRERETLRWMARNLVATSLAQPEGSTKAY